MIAVRVPETDCPRHPAGTGSHRNRRTSRLPQAPRRTRQSPVCPPAIPDGRRWACIRFPRRMRAPPGRRALRFCSTNANPLKRL
ncbi:Hypothetical protein I596_3790 [Dokdonella koreensis DS-123]|uniref:Uncharacterized protein n=1 Tax=Dokdonella koreensis DS-123 TaxID=1300342 RepID=A0A167HBG7_9GAMM|nr:Hypothetical protein I596_3790 [Dokdonella koreensis DS-123]